MRKKNNMKILIAPLTQGVFFFFCLHQSNDSVLVLRFDLIASYSVFDSTALILYN